MLIEHRLVGADVVAGIAHLARRRVVADVTQSQRWLHRPRAVMPQPGDYVEAVVRQELRAVTRDETYCIDDVIGDPLVEEVREVDPHPSRLDALTAEPDLALARGRALEVDPNQPMAVRPRAGAAAARLDAEQVVEQRDDEVVMQIAPARTTYDERHDRQALRVEVAEDLD